MLQQHNNLYQPDEIWCQFLQGDRAAFEQLFDLHAPSLYHYGRKITEDTCLVEDCIQDLFLELWQRRERLSPVNSVRHYLLKSLKRRILQAKEQCTNLSAYTEQNLNSEPSYETQLIQLQTSQEQKEKLAMALSHLTEQQKKVIYLKYYEKLSYDEIATVLSLNKRTVYNLVSLAISELQKVLINPQFEMKMTAIVALLFSFLIW